MTKKRGKAHLFNIPYQVAKVQQQFMPTNLKSQGPLYAAEVPPGATLAIAAVRENDLHNGANAVAGFPQNQGFRQLDTNRPAPQHPQPLRAMVGENCEYPGATTIYVCLIIVANTRKRNAASHRAVAGR